MLVLTRKDGEAIKFPALGITVWVLPRDGHTIRLGIEAPQDIRVIRSELEGRNTSETVDTKR